MDSYINIWFWDPTLCEIPIFEACMGGLTLTPSRPTIGKERGGFLTKSTVVILKKVGN